MLIKNLNYFQKAVRSQLLHEVKNDIRANQSKKLNIAFGKRVPDTTFSTKEDLYKKWLVCDRGTKDVVSMATVWRNIKDLKYHTVLIVLIKA